MELGFEAMAEMGVSRVLRRSEKMRERERGFQGRAACLRAWVEVRGCCAGREVLRCPTEEGGKRPWSSGEMARVCPRGDDVLHELQRIPTAHRALVGEVYSGWNSEQQCSLAG